MSMNPESSIAAPTAQEWALLEAMPCFLFLQSGGRIVFANRVAREALHLEEGKTAAVHEIFQGAFPGFAYARSSSEAAGAAGPAEAYGAAPGGLTSASGNIHGSGNQAYSSRFRCMLLAPGGAPVPVQGTFRMLRVGPEPELLIVAMQATAEAESGPSAHFLEHLLDAAPEAIMLTRGARILHVNREFESLFGYSVEEAVGRSTHDLLIPDTRRHELEILEHAMQMHGRASMETVRLHKSGALIDVSILIGPIEIAGVAIGNFVSYRDIRDKKQSDAKLQYDALHDPLTGLANRALFLDRLQLVMSRQHRRSSLNYAVMFLDLDRFKSVNDSLGHACGDELLMRIGARLRACFRPEDTIARFGGDEFAVLVEDVANIAGISPLAERAQRDIRQPVQIYGHDVAVTASIGIAFGTLDHKTPEQVLRDADFAMYRAKSHGQARYEIFDSSMHVHVAAQIQRERDLSEALERKEFEVWYQPIYRLPNGEIEGFEALLRWRRADGALASLQELLPVAEESGLILSIGFQVIEQVAAQLDAWNSEMPESKPVVSVNLSRRQFQHAPLVDRISEILREWRIPPGRLRLEVTETVINHDPDFAIAAFQRMKDHGLGVALDNFGAGIASMNHLARLPIDLVKVDRRLIGFLPAPGRQSAIIQTIFDLGRLLAVRILAEGVERTEQLEALRRYRCDLAEGHLFSPAVPGSAARALLASGRWPGQDVP